MRFQIDKKKYILTARFRQTIPPAGKSTCKVRAVCAPIRRCYANTRANQSPLHLLQHLVKLVAVLCLSIHVDTVVGEEQCFIALALKQHLGESGCVAVAVGTAVDKKNRLLLACLFVHALVVRLAGCTSQKEERHGAHGQYSFHYILLVFYHITLISQMPHRMTFGDSIRR